MMDVTVANFETEVIAASSQVPVLVDFWAPWCGPCKTLGPILEKLETDYAGRFKLAKIDSDQEQQLAAMFGVRSIPTVVLMMDGQPVDGFMGALPESQVKAFLDKHLPPAEEPSQDEAGLAAPPQDAGDVLQQLQDTLAADPANDDARFDLVRLLLRRGDLDGAKVAFAPAAARVEVVRQLAALQLWINAIDFARASPAGKSAILEYDEKIAADKRDFDARYARARLLIAGQRFTEAMDELLEILMRDKGWNEGVARKAYVAVLDLIEPPRVKVADGQIPPEDPVVASYRRRLSSVVLS